jgi:glycosyltransferase involved in cell wall biosynthesis
VFDDSYKQLQQHHPRIARILVSHSQMEQVILESGIEPPKVHRIPIGINLDYFDVQTPEARKAARRRLNIPDSAVVIGSFQKDGDGWGEGREPKLIKGPDVFLKVIERIKPRVPELFVLLSGPARGYVKAGLARLGVPFRHVYLMDYAEVGLLYQALDLYLVTSRVEGGPKAILESMASGVPLVTTKVGQAMDLVQHGQNAWMVEVEDAEGLAHWAEHALASRQTTAVNEVLRAGRATAEANSYDSQEKQWREFFRGFVETI